jgi:hypothetical protein
MTHDSGESLNVTETVLHEHIEVFEARLQAGRAFPVKGLAEPVSIWQKIGQPGKEQHRLTIHHEWQPFAGEAACSQQLLVQVPLQAMRPPTNDLVDLRGSHAHRRLPSNRFAEGDLAKLQEAEAQDHSLPPVVGIQLVPRCELVEAHHQGPRSVRAWRMPARGFREQPVQCRRAGHHIRQQLAGVCELPLKGAASRERHRLHTPHLHKPWECNDLTSELTDVVQSSTNDRGYNNTVIANCQALHWQPFVVRLQKLVSAKVLLLNGQARGVKHTHDLL